MLTTIEKIERLDSAGKIQGGVVQSNDERERGVFNKLERDLGECTKNMASDFIRRMSAVDSRGKSTFDNMEVKQDDSVTDVCIDVIKGHAIELGLSATLEYGFYVGGFKQRLADAFENGTAMQERMKKVGPALEERNRKLEPGQHLSGQELASVYRLDRRASLKDARLVDDGIEMTRGFRPRCPVPKMQRRMRGAYVVE